MSHPSPIRKCGRHLYVGASFFTWAIRYISVGREESLPFFEGPAIASTCTPSWASLRLAGDTRIQWRLGFGLQCLMHACSDLSGSALWLRPSAGRLLSLSLFDLGNGFWIGSSMSFLGTYNCSGALEKLFTTRGHPTASHRLGVHIYQYLCSKPMVRESWNIRHCWIIIFVVLLPLWAVTLSHRFGSRFIMSWYAFPFLFVIWILTTIQFSPEALPIYSIEPQHVDIVCVLGWLADLENECWMISWVFASFSWY